jgi:site-specific DNA-adenine methylase
VASQGMRPFFGYYGGKWRDTPKNYPAPRHETIVEPFAGSAGYALRYPDRRVVLCERSPQIAAVWRYLIEATQAEIRAIPDIPMDGSVDDLDICEEAKWLVGLWLNRAAASPRKSPSKWMRSNIRPGSFWGERVRSTIAVQVDKIRHWQLIEGDYSNCDVAGPATWFIDPPYQLAGKHYRHGSSEIDFAALARWCSAREGQVIVCENEGADWLPFVPLDAVKTTRAGRRSREVVWLFESPEALDSETIVKAAA